MIEITRLKAKDAMHYWSALKPFIEMALNKTNGEYDADDFQDYIGSEYWETWIAVDINNKELQAVAVTELIEHPNFTELLIRTIAGKDRKNWMNLINQDDTFIAYAKEHNCKRLVMYGRKGWLKVLNKLNWQEGYTVMHKEINYVEKGE